MRASTKAERVNWKWLEGLNSQITPPVIHFLQQGSVPPKPPPNNSLNWDQVFKYLSLWGTFLFKSLQSLSVLQVNKIFIGGRQCAGTPVAKDNSLAMIVASLMAHSAANSLDGAPAEPTGAFGAWGN